MPERAALAAIVVVAAVVAAALVAVTRDRRRARRSLASLDALLVHAPVGIGFLDRDLRFVRVNDAMGRIGHRAPEQYLGLTIGEAVGRPELTAIVRSVLETGVPVFDIEFRGSAPDGTPLHALAGYYPVEGPDGIEGVGVIARDVTASVEAGAERDRLLARVTRLQRVTAALAAASGTDDVTEVVLDEVRRAADADAISLVLLEGGELEVLASEGYRPDVIEPYRRMSLDAEVPIAEAVRTARPVIATTRQEIVRRWPGTSAVLGKERRAVVALPMVVDGAVRGAIGLSYDTDLALSADDEAFLFAMATQCGSTLRRVRLHELESDARAAAEHAANRLAFLAAASELLASSLDWETTLHRVAELAVPHLADTAAVFVVHDDEVEAIEIFDDDPDRQAHLRRLAERWPAHLSHAAGVGAVARTGEALFMPDITPQMLEAAGRDQEHAAALVAAGFRSFLAMPMKADGRVIGLIVLAAAPPRRLTGDDVTLVGELATRAGQAVLNAELFRDRSRVADILQASLLPPATPNLPGLDVATRFFAVGAGIDVGGDFYDVFRLGTVAEPSDRWAVVIGDVRGKGTQAAAISGAARHAIRATALGESSPAVMLARLNDLLLTMASDDDLEPRFCTVAVAVVERDGERARVVLASGGHPPPLVLHADGTTESVDCDGSLLGVLPDAELVDLVLELGPGDSLVLYTDGVTERHSGTRFFDEEALAGVLSRCVGFTASAVAEHIETASRAFVEDAPRDDLAIVVVRVPSSTATATSTAVDLPCDATAPTMGRRFVTAALEALGLVEHVAVAQLLVSEVVTNAFLHAEGPYRLAVEPAGSSVRVAVTDGSVVEPAVQPLDDQRLHGRGLYLVEALAARWGVEHVGTGKSVWFELSAP